MKNINPIPLETGNWRNRLSENDSLSRVPVRGRGGGRGKDPGEHIPHSEGRGTGRDSTLPVVRLDEL